MEKCFLDSDLNQFHEYTEFTVFHNQPLVFQIGVCRYSDRDYKRLYSVQLSGELAPYARVRLVTNLPCEFPCITPHAEGEYLRQTPGLYPDLLRPLNYQNGLILMNRQTQALWITAEPLKDLPAGIYTLNVAIASPEGTPYVEKSAHVRVLNQNLPPQKLIHTEWFYTDCLANAYIMVGQGVMSEQMQDQKIIDRLLSLYPDIRHPEKYRNCLSGIPHLTQQQLDSFISSY